MARDESPPRGLTRGMQTALIAVGAVVVVGAILSASLLSRGGETPSANETSGTASVTSSSSPSSPSSAPGGPDGTQSTAGPLPGGTPISGSEVLPPTAHPGPTLPPVPQAHPLVSAPLPASATKTGGLVTGFPTKIMGPAARTSVVSSSIATEGRTMQVALVGRSTETEADIRAHYALLWASLGLVYQPTTDGTTAFRSRYDSATLSFVPIGTGVQYTVFGVFRTR